MILKKILLIILFFLCFFFFYLLLKKKHTEYFDQKYKSNLVTLSKELTNPLIFNTGKTDSITDSIFSRLLLKFPLVKYNNNLSDDLEPLLSNSCDVCVSQVDYNFKLYSQNQNYSKLKYISTLFIQKSTFISLQGSQLNKDNLSGTTLILDNRKVYIKDNFKNIIQAFGYSLDDFTIIEDDIFSEDSIRKLNINEIDFMYTTIEHPNKLLKNMLSTTNTKLLNFNFSTDIVNKITSAYPNSKKDIINLKDYNVQISNNDFIVNSIHFPIGIFTREDIPEESIYKLFKTLFTQFNFIKFLENKEYEGVILLDDTLFKINNYTKKCLSEIPQSILYSIINTMPYHKGAEKFLRYVGIITNIEDKTCKNYLPDGSIYDIKKHYLNCNNSNINKKNYYGHAYFA